MKIAVIGTGYVGAVVSGALAAIGHQVTAVEIDKARLESFRKGEVPFHEPGLPELIARELDRGALEFTDSYEQALTDATVTFLCVGTPSLEDGSPDTTYVEQAVRSIAETGPGEMVLVTKSTVPIGSGRWLADIVDHGKVSIASNPEFLREGTAIKDFIHPDRVVLGSDDPKAIERLVDVYRPILEQSFTGGRPDHRPGLVTTNLETAEIVKYAANAFLAMKISFINEIAVLADRVGADVTEVATAIGMDRRIGSSFLGAGIGWGGSCFGKDLAALHATSRTHGVDSLITKAVVEVNDRQVGFVADKLAEQVDLDGGRIALLGLAFKPGTDDLRDAPSLKLAKRLIDSGAEVTAFDPIVREIPLDEVTITDSWRQAVDQADAVVLVTEWDEFLSIDPRSLASAMSGTFFLDARNAVDPDSIRAAGLDYVGIGRSE